ncbi:MAG: acyltransferase [Cyanobacteria bacterium J06648_16]
MTDGSPLTVRSQPPSARLTKLLSGVRGVLLKPRFKTCGLPVAIERNVSFRQPHTIQLGDWVRIRQGTQILADVQIGDHVFVGRHCDLGSHLLIESQVTLADYVCVLGHTHDYSNPEKRAGKMFSPGLKVIGAGAWIGYRAVILPQVRHIGKGAVVGAGAIVTRDVPEHTIVAGNPARVVHTLTAADAT